MDYKSKYQSWLDDPFFDEETKNELRALTDEKEIEERFYKDLEFGTAGLRGIMGAGTNRINRYTVGKASLGLATYLKKHFPDAAERGVVIACDTRNNSTTLSRRAADIFTAAGIPTRLFDSPVPTPVLSFAVRHYGCCAGVVLTASHNPSAYNGYKAYDETGCQLGPDAADAVLMKSSLSDVVSAVKLSRATVKNIKINLFWANPILTEDSYRVKFVHLKNIFLFENAHK